MKLVANLVMLPTLVIGSHMSAKATETRDMAKDVVLAIYDQSLNPDLFYLKITARSG